MSKPKTAFHEYSYEMLTKAESHAPHSPTEMISGNSRGPVHMWLCTRARCHEIVYTYSSHETPVCRGGAEWSFTTSLGYVRGLHKEWLGG